MDHDTLPQSNANVAGAVVQAAAEAGIEEEEIAGRRWAAHTLPERELRVRIAADRLRGGLLVAEGDQPGAIESVGASSGPLIRLANLGFGAGDELCGGICQPSGQGHGAIPPSG